MFMIGLLILLNVNGKNSKFPLLGRYGKRRKHSHRRSRNAFISLEGLEDNYMKTTTTKQTTANPPFLWLLFFVFFVILSVCFES